MAVCFTSQHHCCAPIGHCCALLPETQVAFQVNYSKETGTSLATSRGTVVQGLSIQAPCPSGKAALSHDSNISLSLVMHSRQHTSCLPANKQRPRMTAGDLHQQQHTTVTVTSNKSGFVFGCIAISKQHRSTPVMRCGVGIQVQAPGLPLEVPCHGLRHCHSDPLTGVVHDHSLYCIITCMSSSMVMYESCMSHHLLEQFACTAAMVSYRQLT